MSIYIAHRRETSTACFYITESHHNVQNSDYHYGRWLWRLRFESRWWK